MRNPTLTHLLQGSILTVDVWLTVDLVRGWWPAQRARAEAFRRETPWLWWLASWPRPASVRWPCEPSPVPRRKVVA